MDRGKSRSTPYLPRYQSLSPSRSPQLERYRFLSQRTVSQPRERTLYIANEPSRVINSYHVHHSPSPHRTYKIHLCSSKTNHYLTRITRSRSAYDINSSHMYTSHEDLVDKSLQVAAARRVGSCEDIYHKAPFFPDMTPSESGVSFGESEEGSAFGGEDDNVSQHSFGSSSAFCEVTVDSELDKCDSDNFSGPDYVLTTQDENSSKRKLGTRRFYHEPHNPDNNSISTVSYVESRRSELVSNPSWNFDKHQTGSEVLRVLIPDETTVKTSRDSHQGSDRSAKSAKPLAHSTPHVSPGGPGDLKLQATTSWNVDNPFDFTDEMRKYKSAKPVFDQSSNTSRLEESSCYSSCSDDNYSDISNTTISSDVPRKTKLVKKHSDKPASAKIHSQSHLRDLPSVIQSENTESDGSAETAQRGVNSELGKDGCKDSVGFTLQELDTEHYQDQVSKLTGNIDKDDKPVSKDRAGSEWWRDYTASTSRGQDAKSESQKVENEKKLFTFNRDIRNTKALTVNIPLISAGKYGQEKLRQLSQTSPPLIRSNDRSPTLSPVGTGQKWEKGKSENQIVDQSSQVNMDHSDESQGHPLCEVKTSDNGDCRKQENKEKEGKQQDFPSNITRDHSSPLTVGDENNPPGQSAEEIPPIGKTSHNEQYSESFPQAREYEHSEWEVMNCMPNESDRGFPEVTQIERTLLRSNDEVEHTDNSPSSYSEISCETSDIIGIHRDIISLHEDIWPADTSITSVKYAGNLVTVQAADSTNVEDVSNPHIHDQRTNSQRGAWNPCDELSMPSVGGSRQEMRKISDMFSANAVASLPSPAPQVFVPSHTAGKSSANTSGNKKETLSEPELSENNTPNTVCEGTISLLEDRKPIDEYSLENTSSPHSVSYLVQGQFNAGLSSDNIVSLEGSDNVLFTKQPYIAGLDDSNSCYFTERTDRLFGKSSSSKSAIDSATGSSVIKEDQQQIHMLQLSSSFQNTPVVDTETIVENTSMENVVAPLITSMKDVQIPSDGWETLQVVVHVATIEDSTEVSESFPYLHAGVTHHLTSSLTSSDSYKSTERAETSDDFDKLTNSGDTRDNVHQQLLDSSDTCNLHLRNSDSTEHTRNTLRQQEGVASRLHTDITRPVNESIKQPGDVAQRGDQGPDKEEHVCTEKNIGFVERGEEFIYRPDLHRISVIVSDISSKRIEHIHQTSVDKIATIENKINHSQQELNSCDNCAGVDIVKDKSVTESDDYTVITTTLCSDAEKENTVSTETNSLDVHSSTSCLPVFSTTTQEIHLSSPSSPLVSTSHLPAQVTFPAVHILKAKVDNWKQSNTTSALVHADRLYSSVSEVSDMKVGNVLMPSAVTYGAAMHQDSPLDNLQAQLSLISGDNSRSQLRFADGGSDQYQDHAEATSVLKQIVRGDTGDFTQFSHSSCESVDGRVSCSATEGTVVNIIGEMSEPLVTGVESTIVVREHYDNDYDYVTTDLPKGSKLNSRPHHHVQLLKPGQYKASSLWTLPEETENVMDTMSPKPSPKLSRVTSASKEVNISGQSGQSAPSPYTNLNKKEASNFAVNETKNLVSGVRTLVSESSDFEDSDGNYSSISTADSDSRRSSSFGREQTPQSEVESVAMANETDIVNYQKVDNASQRSGNFYEHTSELESSDFTTTRVPHSTEKYIESNQSNSSNHHGEQAESHIKTYKSSVTFCISNPEDKEIMDSITLLDKLTASLEQFEQFSTTDSDSGDWKSLSETGDAPSLSDSRESNLNANSAPTLMSPNDETDNSASCLQTIEVSLNSTTSSPIFTDHVAGSTYTCTGSAEIKKISSYHYDISAHTSETNLKSDVKKTVTVIHDDKFQNEKVKKFDKILDEFNKGVSPEGAISEFVFLHQKRTDCTDSSASSSEDLYKTFTKDESEKTQNHVCIVIEDENMNTYRFKRYLKKSHTKRRKGRKVMRFLSKLGCVSEGVRSPIGSPNPRLKRADEDAQTFSTDSMVSSKPRISNPVLISSTSFHHSDILTPSPLINFAGSSTRFPSNRSLDSMRSRADSAYSSISESVVGALNSPSSQRVLNSSFRIPRASSGSVSSVFCSGSTSGDRSFSDSVFSNSSDTTVRTFSSFSEDDFTRNHPGGTDNEVMSSLSEVFDQLKVCEDEVDSALLNRVRHGHTQAEINKK